MALAAWVSVQRLVEAPERRSMVRREAAVPLIQIGALSTLAAGPVALTVAWWSGFQPTLADSLASIMPAFLGGWTAALGVNLGLARFATWFSALGNAPRRAAQMAFHGVVRFQRLTLALLRRLALTVLAPARDLHTGDAQEFLLFVAGVAVLALVLPLLR